MRYTAVVLALCLLTPGLTPTRAQGTPVPTDLDAFMARVLARRDDNWKKFQQYILDEQERIELRGSGRTPIWSESRDFTWYVRDGFFVRSPVRFNGVEIRDGDRRRYEANFLRRAKRRDQRQAERLSAEGAPPEPRNLQGVIQQLREPQFVSTSYFLQFKFEGGRYGLVGRETVDGGDVLRIEYYPARLFSENGDSRIDRRRSQIAGDESDKAYGAEVSRLMNAGSLVTLWVDPTLSQIVKYTFENTGLEYLPRSWLFRADGFDALMRMSEAFPGVWLPKRVELTAAVSLALGRLDVSYSLDYLNYRQADVTTVIRGASER